MRNQNPVFSTIKTGTTHYEDVDAASYRGIVVKTGFLLGLTVVSAIVMAFYLTNYVSNALGLYMTLVGAVFVGFIAAMIGRISAKTAKYCGAIYAICQGLFLGTISAICEMYFPGVGTIASFSTLLIFGVMLLLYATGVFRQGSFGRKLAYALSIGAIVLTLFTSIMYMFIDFSGISIGVLIAVLVFLLLYGAITLMFNFDEANYVVQSGCGKNEEWSVSLGLIISLIYIYIQILRLILVVLAHSNRN